MADRKYPPQYPDYTLGGLPGTLQKPQLPTAEEQLADFVLQNTPITSRTRPNDYTLFSRGAMQPEGSPYGYGSAGTFDPGRMRLKRMNEAQAALDMIKRERQQASPPPSDEFRRLIYSQSPTIPPDRLNARGEFIPPAPPATSTPPGKLPNRASPADLGDYATALSRPPMPYFGKEDIAKAPMRVSAAPSGAYPTMTAMEEARKQYKYPYAEQPAPEPSASPADQAVRTAKQAPSSFYRAVTSPVQTAKKIADAVFSGEDVQSDGRPVVENGVINWGDIDNPADFFRADQAMQKLYPFKATETEEPAETEEYNTGGRTGYADEGAVVADANNVAVNTQNVAANTEVVNTESSPYTSADFVNFMYDQANQTPDKAGFKWWEETVKNNPDKKAQIWKDFTTGINRDRVAFGLDPMDTPVYMQSFDFNAYKDPLTALHSYYSQFMTPEAASGILGNYAVESMLNPQQVQTANGAANGMPLVDQEGNNRGYGLAMWSPGWVSGADVNANNPKKMSLNNFSDMFGLNPGSLEAQARYSMYGMTQNPEFRKLMPKLENNQNIANATKAFEKIYERAGIANLGRRTNYANLINSYMADPSSLSGSDMNLINRWNTNLSNAPGANLDYVSFDANMNNPNVFEDFTNQDALSQDMPDLNSIETYNPYEFNPLDNVSSATPNYDNYTVGLDTSYKSMPTFTNLSVNPSDYGSFSGSGDLGGASGLTTFSLNPNDYFNAGLNLGYGGNSWDSFGDYGAFGSAYEHGGRAEKAEGGEIEFDPLEADAAYDEPVSDRQRMRQTIQNYTPPADNYSTYDAAAADTAYDPKRMQIMERDMYSPRQELPEGTLITDDGRITDKNGNPVEMIRRPNVLPFTYDEAGSAHFAMPKFLDLIAPGGSNIMGRIGKAATTVPKIAEATPIAKAVNIAQKAEPPAPLPRELSSIGFYNPSLEAARNLQQVKGSPQEYYSLLKNNLKGAPGENFLSEFSGRPSVTRDEVVDYLRRTTPSVSETVSTLPIARVEKVPRIEKEAVSTPGFKNPFDFDENTPSLAHPMTRNEYRFFDQKNKPLFKGNTIQAADPEYAMVKAANRLLEDINYPRFKLPQFTPYNLPNTFNHKEIRLHKTFDKWEPEILKIPNNRFGVKKETGNIEPFNSLEDAQKFALERYKSVNKAKGSFRKAHHGEPDIYAHLLTNDWKNKQGQRIFNIEEIQSDWGQKARKYGYKTDQWENNANKYLEEARIARADAEDYLRDAFENATAGSVNYPTYSQQAKEQFQDIIDSIKYDSGISYKDIFKKLGMNIADNKNLVNAMTNFRKTSDRLDSMGTDLLHAVPKGDFIGKTEEWTNLALRRALQEAAKGGYDKISITPSAFQIHKYKKFETSANNLKYVKNEDGTFSIYPYRNTSPINNLPKINFSIEEIEKMFGKDVAKDLQNSIGKIEEIDGVPIDYRMTYNLPKTAQKKFGEKGLEDFYDKIVPQNLKKIMKKMGFDAKFEKDILDLGEAGSKYNTDFYEMLTMTITPEMRKKILEGMPLYARGGKINIGNSQATDKALEIVKKQGTR